MLPEALKAKHGPSPTWAVGSDCLDQVDHSNSAIRIEMDIIKPDFAGLTWEQWKDTHTEVSMAMSLCALTYTLMLVTACIFRQVHPHFDCWHMCRM